MNNTMKNSNYTSQDLVNGNANQTTQTKFEEFLQEFCNTTGASYEALTEDEKTVQADDFLENNLYS
jgi:hypothetical protein